MKVVGWEKMNSTPPSSHSLKTGNPPPSCSLKKKKKKQNSPLFCSLNIEPTAPSHSLSTLDRMITTPSKIQYLEILNFVLGLSSCCHQF